MTLESNRLIEAENERDAVLKIKEVVWQGLLSVVSEARLSANGLSAEMKERVMDSVSSHFNPEGKANDLFGDCFGEILEDLDERVSDLQYELRNASLAAE